ncbi:bifunctional NAD(P)H-hydrate repair enzyme [Roseibium aquae]|uniref:Bifunctional NAD(P)H-hydrate repair enzyme n=1 Tax=Roseibium aquae TaxID=1323746 RepID=A0A916TMQ3_9HYPH|nr:NAD(P)H-hydrate dehydratase [Roseibium aquae]GGB60684.1 bifunctional NAD(P)H-hydrate repair enzyme [Roseibium aquae]
MDENPQETGSELLTPEEMGEADRLTVDAGVPGPVLMERAGGHVAEAVMRRCRAGSKILILSGPGNNGGDGFVAARVLHEAGYRCQVFLAGEVDRLAGDARLAFDALPVAVSPLDPDLVASVLPGAAVVVDALFGAGLDRPLDGAVAQLIDAVNKADVFVISVDLPSGINGETGAVMGCAVEAKETVTFFRFKLGHFLLPGRLACGRLVCGQIGIDPAVLDKIAPSAFRNTPYLWRSAWPQPALDGHKFTRGHALVFSGGMTTSGAARLAAGAALRCGAGLVTLAAPPSAVMVNAAHLTAVMLTPVAGLAGIEAVLEDPRLNAALIGPGYGVSPETRQAVGILLGSGRAVVLDADALTSFETEPQALFSRIRQAAGPVVLTPHGGEFRRLFPHLAGRDKLSAARAAAADSGAVVVYKGADTVIASPDGTAAINGNAPAWLATAGSGDVLAGIICGLLAQRMPAFQAASMGVWLHGAAGSAAGPGLIAEDIAPALRPVLARLVENPEG